MKHHSLICMCVYIYIYIYKQNSTRVYVQTRRCRETSGQIPSPVALTTQNESGLQLDRKQGGTEYSTVQYSTVQYSTVQYSAVQYSTVQYSTVQYSTVQYSTVQYIYYSHATSRTGGHIL